MQIHENFKARVGCHSSKITNSTERKKSTQSGSSIKAFNRNSYLSLSSCSYQEGADTFDSIMSGESLFKVFNFEPTSNKQDSEKCACFWEQLMKYTNIQPINCTLVKDTRKLKKKKPEPHKEEIISLSSPEFPWTNLYEELRKRKVNFNLGYKRKDKKGLFMEEYENEDRPENLAFLSYWKPKSINKNIETKPKERYFTEKEEETPECSDEETGSHKSAEVEIKPKQKKKNESSMTAQLKKPQNQKEEPKLQSRINEEKEQGIVSQEVTESTVPIVTCTCPVDLYDTAEVISNKGIDKATSTDSHPQVDIRNVGCLICGKLDCTCKAAGGELSKVSEEILEETSKNEQIKESVRTTIEKIFAFANSSKTKEIDACPKPVVEEKRKPLTTSKKILPDQITKMDDKLIVIKPIDALKISSSTESSL